MKQLESSKRRKSAELPVECLDMHEEDIEEDGFIDGDVDLGTPIAFFSFNTENTQEIKAAAVESKLSSINSNIALVTAEQVYKSTPGGITPPVEGESFTVKRSYTLRMSTIRKLNELVNKHPDINVYLNTIVDAAIHHYHTYIFNEGGKF